MQFCEENAYWLPDYALFMAVKNAHQGASLHTWEEDIRTRQPEALSRWREETAEETDFYCFLQYEFMREWKALREYANKQGIEIIGDIPIYVSDDSSDFWAHPELFQVDERGNIRKIAGVPPDGFSADGQIWGNPLYDWEQHEKDGYGWWKRRIGKCRELYDVIRLDHFHGFCEYYGIPYGDETAENGKSYPGPGMKLFHVLEKELGSLRMIAEDLGNNTPENQKLLEDSGFPGMKVLQYGFTSWDSIYLNHRHTNRCVVYTGTHDNTPTRAWVEEINEGERDFTRRYINSLHSDYGALVWDIIREAYRSVANLCIIPLADYLCKGKEARLNTPGTGDGNWQWRLTPNALSEDLARSIRSLAEVYSRIPKEEETKSENAETVDR